MGENIKLWMDIRRVQEKMKTYKYESWRKESGTAAFVLTWEKHLVAKMGSHKMLRVEQHVDALNANELRIETAQVAVLRNNENEKLN